MTEHIQINDVAPLVHYDADGVQAAFTFPFAVFKATDLEVWLNEAKTPAGFTLSGVGISSGGAALFAVPPAAGTRVTLRRRMALERISDFQADGIIRAKTLNDELDYQVAAVQQVADDVSRCVQRPFTSSSTAALTLPDPVGGRGLKWNAAGTGLENSAAGLDEAVAVATAQAHAAIQARAATDADHAAVAADRAAVGVDRQAAAAAAVSAAADRAAVTADRTAVATLRGQAEVSAVAAESSALSVGTRLLSASTSTLTLGTGTRLLEVEPAKGWVAGMTVTIFVTAEPGRFMTGQVSSYDPSTGALQVMVEDVQGIGSASAWTVVIGGRRGMAGTGSGDLQAVNALAEIAALGAGTKQAARGNLGLGGLAIKGTAAATDLALSAPAILGRAAAGAGNAAELSLSQVLDLVGGATRGDLLYRGASGWARLPAAGGLYLKSNGSGADPAWATAPGRVLGVAATSVGGVAASTATIPYDDTPRLITRGHSSWG
ncbi:MAG: hypothetical protein NVV74_25640 [Magnetospirillum sp.]|nr:hypothetical protein [Magnetospirillum sp.]